MKKDPLLIHLKEFLSKKKKKDSPFLLALSGGPDSLCLFFALLEAKIPFAVAHIDHGWREESAQEYLEMQALAKKFSIPFFGKKLEKPEGKQDLENKARQQRFAFFKELIEKNDFDALLTGHQKDDGAETVLKRVLESAHLFALQGIEEESQREGVRFLRPLLAFPKKELVDWLKVRGHSYFKDSTNEDTYFLRARLRKILIPFMSKCFGKEIVNPLAEIAKESIRLQEYLERKSKSLAIKEERQGNLLCVHFSKDADSYELYFLVRKYALVEGFCLPKEMITKIVSLLMEKGAAPKEFIFKIGKVSVKKRTLLFEKEAN